MSSLHTHDHYASIFALLAFGAPAPAAPSPPASHTAAPRALVLPRRGPHKRKVNQDRLVQHLGLVGAVDGGPRLL